MADKRVSRSRKRELDQPDEFVTLSGKAFNYFNLNKQKIINFSAILALLLILVAGVHYYNTSTEAKAFLLLEKGIKKYEALKEKNGPDEVYSEVKEDFEMVLSRYSGRKAGNIARVMLADICFDAGEYNRAIELYEQSLDKLDQNAFYTQMIYNGLGYAYEQKNEFEKAIMYLEKITSGSAGDFKEDALYNLARLYSKTGHPDKAIDCYKQIQADFPDSIYTNMIKENLNSES